MINLFSERINRGEKTIKYKTPVQTLEDNRRGTRNTPYKKKKKDRRKRRKKNTITTTEAKARTPKPYCSTPNKKQPNHGGQKEGKHSIGGRESEAPTTQDTPYFPF